MKHFQKIILSFLFAAITFLISANTNVFREQNPESKKVYAENVHKQQELHTVKPQVLFDGEISPEIVWARILTAQPTRSLQTSHLQTLQYLPFRTQKTIVCTIRNEHQWQTIRNGSPIRLSTFMRILCVRFMPPTHLARFPYPVYRQTGKSSFCQKSRVLSHHVLFLN